MKKRYQVFVSSTFADLETERREVMQALLELDCIPSGMELFPAADDDQWTLIQSVIDDCDYYIVIVAGRYGSVSEKTGMSYTEMEYRYAAEKKKPILGFYHDDPRSILSGRTDDDPIKKAKLKEFLTLVKQKMCRPWTTPQDLGGAVSRSMVSLIKTRPAVGWVRADECPSGNSASEILRQKIQIEQLEAELHHLKGMPLRGTEDLAQGDDVIMLPGFYVTGSKFSQQYAFHVIMSWNDIFHAMIPALLDGAYGSTLSAAIEEALECSIRNSLEIQVPSAVSGNVRIDKDFFETALMQFQALGIIDRGNGPDAYDDGCMYFTLTSFGKDCAFRERAIKKGSRQSNLVKFHVDWEALPPQEVDASIPF